MIVKLTSSALVDSLGNPTGLSTVELNTDPTNPGPNDTLKVMGFGTTQEGGGLADELYEVDVLYVSDEDCAASYGSSFDADSMFCAGVEEGGKDSCQGESDYICFWVGNQ